MNLAQMIFLGVLAYAVALPTFGAWREPPGWRFLGGLNWFTWGFAAPVSAALVLWALVDIWSRLS